MTQLDLDRTGPERLLDEAEPEGFAATIEAFDNWTPRRLALVDDVLTGWVAEYIARPRDRDGLIALQGAIERILQAPASRSESMGGVGETSSATYAIRWKGFSDAIEARDITLAEREPERVLHLRHVAEIVEMASESGEISQRDVQARLQLSPSRLSQVLALMESHGLIERRTAGRDKFVSLPVAAVDTERVAPAPAGVRRGSSYLTLARGAA